MSNPAIRFRAALEQSGKTATGVTVPEEVLAALGGGRRPPVRVTLNEHTYESAVGSMNGVAKIPVSAAVRQAADVTADASDFFASLTPSRRKACVTWVDSAKKAETRQTRVTRAVEMLAAGTPPR